MRGFFRHKPPEQDAAEVPPGSRGTILVVDDSPTETRIFMDALTKAGFRVETAKNGEEGVRFARRHGPDLILMDVVMPVLNGFQATRQLRGDPATAAIPIIIVSSKDQPTDRTWGLRQGAVDYLVKPVDVADLIDKIGAILRG
jgi:twitching motility two-component system response regulator PilH